MYSGSRTCEACPFITLGRKEDLVTGVQHQTEKLGVYKLAKTGSHVHVAVPCRNGILITRVILNMSLHSKRCITELLFRAGLIPNV